MTNPFASRLVPLSGPATDLVPVTPDDTTALPNIGVALFVETGGTVRFVTVAGQTRDVSLPDHALLPVGVRQVLSTGTSASGIHALMVN